MKISIIWLLAEKEELNRRTLECLGREAGACPGFVEFIIYADGQDRSAYDEALKASAIIWCERGAMQDVECYNAAFLLATGDLISAVSGGDSYSEGAFAALQKCADKYPKEKIFMVKKTMPDGLEGAFSTSIDGDQNVLIRLKQDYAHHPFYFGGTFLRTECCKSRSFQVEYGLEAEQELFLSLAMSDMKLVFCQQVTYFSEQSREGDFTFFKDIYEKDWYEKSLDDFWVPYLQECGKQSGTIPFFIQYQAMFSIRNRIAANWNNRNKHVITEGHEPEVLAAIGRVIRLLDNAVIYNTHKLKESEATDSMKWIYGILKNGEGFHFDRYCMGGNYYFGTDRILFNRLENLKTNIVFMDYRDGILHIDGTVHQILYSMAAEVYFRLNGKKYPLEYNERYTLNKAFGVSIYREKPFHLQLPVGQLESAVFGCYAEVEGVEILITFSYESHFSRMSGTFQNSYWCFGTDPMYLCTKEPGGLKVRRIAPRERRRQERRLAWEMLASFNKRAWTFWAIRRVYFALRPFMKRRPIWMYLDKIYKAGDSSEYLYRYASAQDNNFRHYYLVDKKSSDYRRLKRDGYHPLVRGTVKHRLVFLMADMMVISNSTVFAFNNFGLPNSSYVRDLVDFHVCCVQHGMSVQKIAVAQHRLRDNTRLYFCASKYEIENLSRPVYDYVGYDALKLTGVPRYDGLVNDDRKQILISPTWRMQAAVPVRTSEGEQRDYNPLFKESTYYRIYNALINDPRLIEAAKKYGYRIKYVLHPIVSAQVDDFDKNDYVDVIPAVGDMSYERVFCESSLMVTDFSGIQFDFAYMRKPLVYLHHRDIPQHYEEGSFFYDTMAFGEIAHDNDELIDLLCEYMANGCKMKEEYVRRADDFFYYSDHENCKRIYEVMLEYQDKNVLHKEK